MFSKAYQYFLVIFLFLISSFVFAQESLEYFPSLDHAHSSYVMKVDRTLSKAYSNRSNKIPLIMDYRANWESANPVDHFESFLGEKQPFMQANEKGKIIFTSDYFPNREIVVDVYGQYFRLLEHKNGKRYYLGINYSDLGDLAFNNRDRFYVATHFDYSKFVEKKYIDNQVIKKFAKASRWLPYKKQSKGTYGRHHKNNCNKRLR